MDKRIKWLSSCGLVLMMLSASEGVNAQTEESTIEPIQTTQTSVQASVNHESQTTTTTPTEETLQPDGSTESVETTASLLSSEMETVSEDVSIEETETNETTQEKVETSQPSEEIRDWVKVIVQTNNQAALDRADYHDSESYRLAVLQSEQEVHRTVQEISDFLKAQGMVLEQEHEFSASFTGFSAKVNQAMIDQLKQMTQVLSVNIAAEAKETTGEAYMNSSGPLIGTDILSEYHSKYKGENIVVSVIDTGFDPYHRDFVLADDIEKRYDQAEMNEMIQNLGLPGKWYSNKVAYGYNYADNIDMLQSADEHGNHVAGTIGANGDVENGGIQGIAPHVQLLLMKAFSEDQVDSSVYEDIWMKAFDDSIKLGADIINMSLGMSSGFNMNGDTPMARAIQKARDKGILPLIAAGNDRVATWGTDYKQLASNPDNGTLGYPANVDSSMAVASFDNLMEMRRYVEALVNGTPHYFPGSFTYPEGYSELRPLVEFGKGLSADYQKYAEENGGEVDFTGKIVLVQRGDATFNEKYQLAREHNAEGVIIYDNVDSLYTMEMTGIENLDIPVMFVTLKSGEQLKTLAQQDALFRISKELQAFQTPTAGNLSEFSSWGPTNDLLLKPDIAGPGGFIYSLMSDDRYQNMSGTSMATPHMAGMAALLIQRLYDEGILVRNGEEKDVLQDDLTMLFLMNTAVPRLNTLVDGASYFTPIQQGAGLANIHHALNNFVTVVATNEADAKEDGKLELKEVGDEFQANFKLHNYGQTDETYTVSYVLLKDKVDENDRYTETTDLAGMMTLGEVTVKAGQTATVDHLISTLGIDRNQYVQGYFFFKPLDTTKTELSLPFFGFKGEWDKLPIIDNLIDFTGEKEVNFLPITYPNGGIDKTGFVRPRLEQGWDYFNAWQVDGEGVVFVNSNEMNDFKNIVTPKLSFLRDAVDVTFKVEDESNQKIRDLVMMNRWFKVNRLYNDEYRFLQDAWGIGWDYTDTFGEHVGEGTYYYVVEAQIDAPDAERQRYQYKMVLDNTAASLEADRQENQLTLKVLDNLSGIFGVEVYTTDNQFVDWQEVNKQESPQLLEGEFTVNLAPELLGKDLYIWVYDNARNIKQFHLLADGSLEEVVNEAPQPGGEEEPEEPTADQKAFGEKPANPNDYITEIGLDTVDIPAIVTNSPWYYQPIGQDAERIDLSGTISNFNKVNYLEYRIIDEAGNVVIDYQPVAFELNDAGEVLFAADITTEPLKQNGVYSVEMVAYVESPSGKLVKQQVAQRVRRDVEAPQMLVNQIFGEDEDLLYFEITFSDNMNYVELWANNDMIGRVDKTYDSLNNAIPVDGKVIYTIPKSKIGQEITFAVYDDFGNKTDSSQLLVKLLDLTSIEPQEEKRFNPDLAIGEVKEVQLAKEGKANIGPDGKLIVIEEAQNRIVEYGPTEIPFEVEYQRNDYLTEGMEIILQEGMKGLVNPLTGEIIRAAQKQIIVYGTKVDLPANEGTPDQEEWINGQDLEFYLNPLKDKLSNIANYHQAADFDLDQAMRLVQALEQQDLTRVSLTDYQNWKASLIAYLQALTPKHGSQAKPGESLNPSAPETSESASSVEGMSILPQTGEQTTHSYSLIAGFLALLGSFRVVKSLRRKENI